MSTYYLWAHNRLEAGRDLVPTAERAMETPLETCLVRCQSRDFVEQ